MTVLGCWLCWPYRFVRSIKVPFEHTTSVCFLKQINIENR